MVLTAHPGEAMASPETLEALEECRARIELLSHVNETSLRKLSKKQLVGVVGDLLAMAARQEFERARRFETATSSASVRRAKEKAEREAALRRERERAEQAERAAIRERRVAAAVTIRSAYAETRCAPSPRTDAKRWRHEKDLREAEARAAEAVRREAASTTIQSAFRARVARREAKSRWLQAWASRRRASSRRRRRRSGEKKNAPRKRKRRESVSVRVLRGRSGGVCGLAERDAAAARTGAVPPGRLRERRGVRRARAEAF